MTTFTTKDSSPATLWITSTSARRRDVSIEAVVVDIGAGVDAYERHEAEAEPRQIEHRAVAEDVAALFETFDPFVDGGPLEAHERAEFREGRPPVALQRIEQSDIQIVEFQNEHGALRSA